MKNLFTLLFLFLPIFSIAQQKVVTVIFDVNFEHVKSAQRKVNGVIYDGKSYHQIKQGKGEAKLLSGEQSFSLRIAVAGNPEEYSKVYDKYKIPQRDTLLLELTIPDSYLPSLNSIALIDFKGPFYPGIENDSLNCVDLEGRRNGLWFDMDHKSGNCIDFMTYHYKLYQRDTIIAALDFEFNYNMCEEKPYIMVLYKYDEQTGKTQVMHQFILNRGFGAGLKPGEAKGVDHNYLTPNRAKQIMKEYRAIDYKQLIPTFILDTQLKGNYIYNDYKNIVETEIK